MDPQVLGTNGRVSGSQGKFSLSILKYLPSEYGSYENKVDVYFGIKYYKCCQL